MLRVVPGGVVSPLLSGVFNALLIASIAQAC